VAPIYLYKTYKKALVKLIINDVGKPCFAFTERKFNWVLIFGCAQRFLERCSEMSPFRLTDDC